MNESPALALLWEALPTARIVGGAVRDRLAGRPVVDIDLAIPLEPAHIIASLRAAGLRGIPTGLAHGTVTALVQGQHFQITSLRRDITTDGRHAVVAFTDDWELDASRRDFTINAMSETQDGQIFDYFNGQADLHAGRVRFIGAAQARIAEDYLRMLRFFRFLARYGRGTPDAQALSAIRALREGLNRLSAERVWTEMKNILAAPEPQGAVTLMQETGILPLIWPGLDVQRLAALVAYGAPADPLLRTAALLGGAGMAAFAARWRLSSTEQSTLQGFCAPNRLSPGMDDATLRRALAMDETAILIGQSWLAGDSSPGWAGLRARLGAMARPVFPLHGRDVLAAGIPPGPRVGQILQSVRQWWYEGGCVADAPTCRARIMQETARENQN